MIFKYKKRPITIEAIRVPVRNDDYHNSLLEAGEFAGWMLKLAESGNHHWEVVDQKGTIAVKTLEGTMLAKPGDFIIKGIEGELYPCDYDIFMKTYERVD